MHYAGWGSQSTTSRIYLVLIKMGPIKASELSFFGQLPRTKTYGAIKELERKGLLRIIPGKPESYAPSSPSEVLMPLVTKLSHELGVAEEIVQNLAVAYESSKFVKRDTPKEAEQFWEIQGRPGIINKLNQIFGEASEDCQLLHNCGRPSSDSTKLIVKYSRRSVRKEQGFEYFHQSTLKTRV